MPPLRANTGAAYNNTVVTTAGVNWTSKGIEPRKDGLAATIKPQNGNQCPTAIINQKIRRLTPLECERLQGFPPMWTEGISDTQRYRCLGNAVTVPVIEAIMTGIREKGGL
jgi:DNA (cytosine-5)-methyltransferase 1